MGRRTAVVPRQNGFGHAGGAADVIAVAGLGFGRGGGGGGGFGLRFQRTDGIALDRNGIVGGVPGGMAGGVMGGIIGGLPSAPAERYRGHA